MCLFFPHFSSPSHIPSTKWINEYLKMRPIMPSRFFYPQGLGKGVTPSNLPVMRRRSINPDRCNTVLSRQCWIFLCVNFLFLFLFSLSLSFFISVRLPFSHCLPRCALYNFLLYNESSCLLSHRRRGFVKSTWISSIFCPIIPLFYSPPPRLFLLSLSPPVHLSSTQGIPFAAQSGLLH